MNLSTSKTGSYSCQCTTTLHGEKKETKNNVNTIHRQLRIMLANFPRGRWSFLGPGSDGSWNQDPVSAFVRGELRSKGGGKKSIHFNGSEENIELLLRTIISANQLSVYGQVADVCKELSEDSESLGKPEAPDHLETMEIPAGPHTNEQQQRKLVQDYERRFEQLSDDQKLSKLCPDAGSRIV